MESGENASETPPDDREFELAPAPLPLGTPLFTGLVLGLLLLQTLQRAGVSEIVAVAAGLGWALATGTLASWLARRQQPDRIRVTHDTVSLARGDRAVRTVRLSRLGEVNELQTAGGPVLLLADDKQTLAVAASQMAIPRAYEEVTALLVERMQRLDPTGEVGRSAVAAGRVRDVVAQQPVRGTPILAGIIGLATLLSMLVLRRGVVGRPFPLEDIGALSRPLLEAGETWRTVSYVFLDLDGLHLAIVLVGILWLGAYLERLVGWERVLLGFLAGTVGGALGFAFAGQPLPAVGATPGVFGLIGLLAAVATVGRRHLPRAMLPRPGFWLVTALLAVLLPLGGPVGGVLLGADAVVAGWLATVVLTHGAAVVLGWVVGVALVGSGELPSPDEDRRPWRAFAVLAALALGIGVVGGVTHAQRDHEDDAEIIAEAFRTLPEGLGAATYQNFAAYTMVIEPAATSEAIDIGARLAEEAVRNSDRHLAAILDTLAVARYRQGRPADARALIEEALRLEPADSRMRTFLERRLQDMNQGRELEQDLE